MHGSNPRPPFASFPFFSANNLKIDIERLGNVIATRLVKNRNIHLKSLGKYSFWEDYVELGEYARKRWRELVDRHPNIQFRSLYDELEAPLLKGNIDNIPSDLSHLSIRKISKHFETNDVVKVIKKQSMLEMNDLHSIATHATV